jgi:hypothetical protein
MNNYLIVLLCHIVAWLLFCFYPLFENKLMYISIVLIGFILLSIGILNYQVFKFNDIWFDFSAKINQNNIDITGLVSEIVNNPEKRKMSDKLKSDIDMYEFHKALRIVTIIMFFVYLVAAIGVRVMLMNETNNLDRLSNPNEPPRPVYYDENPGYDDKLSTAFIEVTKYSDEIIKVKEKIEEGGNMKKLKIKIDAIREDAARALNEVNDIFSQNGIDIRYVQVNDKEIMPLREADHVRGLLPLEARNTVENRAKYRSWHKIPDDVYPWYPIRMRDNETTLSDR